MKFSTVDVRNEIVNAEEGTKVYFACDSRRYKNKKGEWWISFATVAVIHLNGRCGCRVYGKVEKERDYTGSMRMRLVREAHKATEMALLFEEDLILYDVPFEIHLDINSNDKHKSNIALKEAAGYVLGMLGMKPKFKPEAFAASCTADVFELKQDKVIPRRKIKNYLRQEHEKNANAR